MLKIIGAIFIYFVLTINGTSWSSWEVLDNSTSYLQRTLLCGENNEIKGASCVSNGNVISSFKQIASKSCNSTECLDNVEEMFPGPEVRLENINCTAFILL